MSLFNLVTYGCIGRLQRNVYKVFLTYSTSTTDKRKKKTLVKYFNRKSLFNFIMILILNLNFKVIRKKVKI